MSVRLIEKLNGPQVLSGMLNRIFKSESPELTDVLSAISNPDPDGPRVYAIDTEFYQPHKEEAAKFRKWHSSTSKLVKLSLTLS
jgi:hypothetical protein